MPNDIIGKDHEMTGDRKNEPFDRSGKTEKSVQKKKNGPFVFLANKDPFRNRTRYLWVFELVPYQLSHRNPSLFGIVGKLFWSLTFP